MGVQFWYIFIHFKKYEYSENIMSKLPLIVHCWQCSVLSDQWKSWCWNMGSKFNHVQWCLWLMICSSAVVISTSQWRAKFRTVSLLSTVSAGHFTPSWCTFVDEEPTTLTLKDPYQMRKLWKESHRLPNISVQLDEETIRWLKSSYKEDLSF